MWLQSVLSTCVDGVRWELARKLLSHKANASGGQTVLACGQASHDKFKEP